VAQPARLLRRRFDLPATPVAATLTITGQLRQAGTQFGNGDRRQVQRFERLCVDPIDHANVRYRAERL
jgi:hypothetical protein